MLGGLTARQAIFSNQSVGFDIVSLLRITSVHRRNDPAVGLGLSEAQWFSMALVAVGVIMLIRRAANANS